MKRIGYIDGRRIVGRTSTGLSGVSRGMQITQIYDPPTQGYETTIGFAGKAQLAAGKKFIGGQGFMWGLQGQLDFQDGAEVEQANAIFSALRGVITRAGTPVFTDAEGLCCLYLDNLAGMSMKGLAGGYNSSMIFIANNGAYMDSAIRIKGARLDNFIYFEDCMGHSVETSLPHTGQAYCIKVLIDFAGTTRVAYIDAAEA